MIIYERPITGKLQILRLSFFILLSACIFAFTNNQNNLGYFLVVTIVTISFFVIRNITVTTNSLQVSKYYFFGLVIKKWHFNKGELINISSYGSDFGVNADWDNFEDGDSGIGCLFSILSIFVSYKITMKQFKIEQFGDLNNKRKTVSLFLNKIEFRHLQDFVE